MIGRQPKFISAVKGDNIVLPCDVTGTPAPRILWQKGASMITSSPGQSIQSFVCFQVDCEL